MTPCKTDSIEEGLKQSGVKNWKTKRTEWSWKALLGPSRLEPGCSTNMNKLSSTTTSLYAKCFRPVDPHQAQNIEIFKNKSKRGIF